MSSREENELITRVAPGTSMGELMRRYWLPALLSWELPELDCPPVRVKLLGEKLLAFRDSHGRVGVLDEFCAHRRASLFLGRNEEGGLRCVYHGWKYDVDGICTDMPNEPPEYNFKHKIRLKAYSTVELGGVIWTYMGPREKVPPLPKFEWTQVPETHRHVTKTWQECNWLQALEGGIDSSHSSFLHRALTDDALSDGIRGLRVTATAPKQEVEVTTYGHTYVSRRPIEERGEFVRVYHYIMPFHTLFAQQNVGYGPEAYKPQISGHMFVPMDDENTMVYNLFYSFGEPSLNREELERRRGTAGGLTAGFRKVRNKDNDWLIDREKQKTRTFTGIEGINTQDHAVQESMGPIVDRTQEHLGSSDRAILATRRLLIQAIKTARDGKEPPGIAPTYYKLRAIEKILPSGDQWRVHLEKEIYVGQ